MSSGGVATLPAACLASQDSSSSSVVLPALGVGNIRASAARLRIPPVCCPSAFNRSILARAVSGFSITLVPSPLGVGHILAVLDKPSPFPVFGLVPGLSVLVGVGHILAAMSSGVPKPLPLRRSPLTLALRSVQLSMDSCCCHGVGVGHRLTKSGRPTECMESSDG